MRRDFLPRAGGCLFLRTFSAFWPSSARADQYIVDDRQAMTIDQPGAFVGLSTGSATTAYDYMGPDALVPTGGNVFSFAAALDTGASGCVVAAFMANGRGLPTTGGTYSDVGIGGTETFNVSQPTWLKIASVGVGAVGSEVLSNFSPCGPYNLQVRQSDPEIDEDGFLDPVYVNVVGTPVLNKCVMHVRPNGNTFSYYVDGGLDLGLGLTSISVPSTTLKPTCFPRRRPRSTPAAASWYWCGRTTAACCTCR